MSIGLSLTDSYSGAYAIFILFDVVGLILIFFVTKVPKANITKFDLQRLSHNKNDISS